MELPTPKVRDRRVQRTQRQLQDGLRSLLRQKPIEEIAVLEITQAADVNRATFYDHYTDKHELFNALIAADFQEVLARRNVCFDGSCSSGLGAIVLAVGDFLEQMHRDRPDCSGQAASGPLIDAAITLAVRGIVLDGVQSQALATAAPPEVFASMVSGSVYGAVKESLSKGAWRVDEAALLSLVPLLQPLLEPPRR